MSVTGRNVLKRVALIEGDGIGPEIAESVKRIFSAAKVPIEWLNLDVTPIKSASGSYSLPSTVIDTLKNTKIGLKGPLTTPVGTGMRSLNLEIRKTFDLYANVRPCKSIPSLQTIYGNVDVVTIRENTEGEYSGIEHMITDDLAQSVKVISNLSSTKISKFAFEYAEKHQRNNVTVCHKANIMRKADGMFLKSARKVAQTYKDKIKFNEARIDTACLRLIQNPFNYDVLLMPNLYGDIMSDLCSGLIGGLGLTPSANIGNEISVFEAVHGSAPDIAGKNKANPTALLLSGVMMLRHLKLDGHADKIEKSVHKTLAVEKNRTMDLPGGQASCTQYTDKIIQNL